MPASASTITIRPAELGHDDYETSDSPGYHAELTLPDGTVACTAQYEDREDHLWLRWIETTPEHRRNGHAAAILDTILENHPDAEAVFTSDFTDDGENLRGRVHQE
jgi:GNAT superfamily N-acetyltransferase